MKHCIRPWARISGNEFKLLLIGTTVTLVLYFDHKQKASLTAALRTHWLCLSRNSGLCLIMFGKSTATNTFC